MGRGRSTQEHATLDFDVRPMATSRGNVRGKLPPQSSRRASFFLQ